MRRNAGLGAAALLLAACGGADLGPPVYGADQCRRVALLDAETGASVRGAEDLAVDADGGRLIVSAYDRRAVERTARRNGEEPPHGGVYTAPFSELFDGSRSSVEASPLIDPASIAGGLRPHGIHFDPARRELAFINRAYQREGRKWRMTPRLERMSLDNGTVSGPAPGALSCAANNVLLADQKVFTSFDHGSCGWRGGFEDVFGLKRSGLALDGAGPVFDRASFANGLARTGDGEIVMAATRENVLIFFEERPEGVDETARVKLPGGPDNLSVSHDGRIVAATHPSMFRLALNRKLGVGRAPSRVVKTDRETDEPTLLFDDPSGKLFSAATVAVETGEGMIVGSVTDEGVLVCRSARAGEET